jgi:lipoprotein signal peptidase
MIALSLTVLVVLVSDQALKVVLRRALGSDAIARGPLGSVRIVAGRLWLSRIGGLSGGAIMWCFWVTAAAALAIVSAWTPSCGVFAGLLLGGSLSNAVESSLRGTVTDYACLRFWPAFNLADLALAAGAIGNLAELLIAVRGTAS